MPRSLPPGRRRRAADGRPGGPRTMRARIARCPFGPPRPARGAAPPASDEAAGFRPGPRRGEDEEEAAPPAAAASSAAALRAFERVLYAMIGDLLAELLGAPPDADRHPSGAGREPV